MLRSKPREIKTIEYQAPKPVYHWSSWVSFYLVRVLFAPIMLWDFTKWVFNKLLGETVGSMVLPAQNNDYEDLHGTMKKTLSYVRQPVLAAQFVAVNTHDGVKLDTLEMISAKDNPYIVNFVGNGMCYEQIVNDYLDDDSSSKHNFIGFNYRGVSKSTGKATSSNDLVIDGIAVVQRLLDQGVDPAKIILKGLSLGGGIATLVAKHFHDLGIQVNLFNDRSFSSISNVVVGHARSGGRSFLGWLVKPFIMLGIALVKWEISSAHAFKALPDSHKEYVVVRSDKQRRAEYGEYLQDDPVITHYGSLHAALKSERRQQKSAIIKAINELERTDESIKAATRHLNERKMTTAVEKNGHVVPAYELVDRYQGDNAKNFFLRFFERTQNRSNANIPEQFAKSYPIK